jgi:hypothetical protein
VPDLPLPLPLLPGPDGEEPGLLEGLVPGEEPEEPDEGEPPGLLEGLLGGSG